MSLERGESKCRIKCGLSQKGVFEREEQKLQLLWLLDCFFWCWPAAYISPVVVRTAGFSI